MPCRFSREKRLVYTRIGAVNDHDVWPVAGKKSAQNRLRELPANPEAAARHYDTHVQNLRPRLFPAKGASVRCRRWA